MREEEGERAIKGERPGLRSNSRSIAILLTLAS